MGARRERFTYCGRVCDVIVSRDSPKTWAVAGKWGGEEVSWMYGGRQNWWAFGRTRATAIGAWLWKVPVPGVENEDPLEGLSMGFDAQELESILGFSEAELERLVEEMTNPAELEPLVAELTNPAELDRLLEGLSNPAELNEFLADATADLERVLAEPVLDIEDWVPEDALPHTFGE